MTRNNSLLHKMASLIDEVEADTRSRRVVNKSAADNEAGGSGSAKTDPGGYAGPSTHPSAKADGGLHPATPGARANENKEDVKKDVPVNVNEASDNSSSSDEDHVQIGTKKSPTGGDPSTEDAYKGTKQDPGTAHPADAESTGEKYSAMQFPALYKVACDSTNDLLARLLSDEGFTGGKRASETPEAVKAAAQAGHDLAASIDDASFLKEAAADVVMTLYREGEEDAKAVGDYLSEYSYLSKQAAGDPMGGAIEGGAPGGDPMAAMGGGMPPEGGGMPPEGGEGGMPPEGGGMPPEGGEGGQMDPETAINELANALHQAGIPPEHIMELIEAVAHGGEGGEGGEAPPGGEGGEMPPEGGAEPGAEMAKAAMARCQQANISWNDLVALHKTASNVQQHLESGRFRLRRVHPASKEAAGRQEAAQYINYVTEVLSRRA